MASMSLLTVYISSQLLLPPFFTFDFQIQHQTYNLIIFTQVGEGSVGSHAQGLLLV